MPVRYLLCTDFKRTCFPVPKTLSWAPELIEFAAVLLNLQSGQMEQIFHNYVRPTEFPILSHTCIEKTHINQREVNSGNHLALVLDNFEMWTQKICYEKNLFMPTTPDLYRHMNYMVICTWSHDKIGTSLNSECYNKDIDIPDILQFWVDAQKAALNQGFCEDLDLTMLQIEDGRIAHQNDSLDDLRKCTRVAYNLHEQFGEKFDDLESMIY